MKNIGTVTLETERLLLRQFKIEDAQAMFKNWASNPNVTRFLTWPTHSNIKVTEGVLESWISQYGNNEYYQWAIELKDIGEPIGSISVVESNPDIMMVHIGYCIGEGWWNQGYTSEALRKIIQFFFEEVGVNRVESRHSTNNPKSGQVMLKCGMIYEGISRDTDKCNLGISNSKHYSILASDYKYLKRN